MSDPTLPTRLHHRADELAAAGAALIYDTAGARWRSTAAEVMRDEASGVRAQLQSGSVALRDAAGALAVAQGAAATRAREVLAEAARAAHRAETALATANDLARDVAGRVAEAGQEAVSTIAHAAADAASAARRAEELAARAVQAQGVLRVLGR